MSSQIMEHSLNFICFQTKLFPAIHLHWSNYKSALCEKIKDAKEVVVSGDGCHDSIGHSAKYCVYTLFCHDPFNVIFDFNLVQVSFCFILTLLLVLYIALVSLCFMLVNVIFILFLEK